MDFNMEWNAICRVCLQEGDLRSLYDKDDKDLTICYKLVKCSNITIKRGMNLPEQICSKCLNDLEVAYRFRTNCESADAILQSFVEGNVITDLIMSSENGEVYKYRPPQGLNVKRIRPLPVKLEPNSDDNDDGNIENIIIDNGFSDHETLTQDVFSDVPTMKDEHLEKLMIDTIDDDDKDICTIKPVKTNKARSKSIAAKNKMKVVPAQAVTTKPDGTTIIRYRKSVVEDQKPLKICEICGNTYKYKHALESHMRRHRNEKPFSCEICGRSFVINFELRRHMRTHTGQKPYACRFCGRKFSDFGSRIKHERTHTGERPYTCETCGKAFAYSHVLSSHILTHTGEKRFGCSICNKRFTKSHHLKAHLNTHMKNTTKHVNFMQATATSDSNQLIEETNEAQVVYDKVYGEVLAVLNGQPKIEEFGDEDDAKVISENEHRHAIDSINMDT